MSNHFPAGQMYTSTQYTSHEFVQSNSQTENLNDQQQQFFIQQPVQHYLNTGLEIIQESERSSYDNNQNLQDRRQELKESMQCGGEYEQEQQYNEDIDQSNQAAFRSLLSKISQLESELIKERASNSVKRTEQYQSYSSETTQRTRDSETNQPNLQTLRQQIIVLEEKLVKIQLENERLNNIVQSQNKTIDRLQSNSQQQFESLLSEQVNEYMNKAEKLLDENENLSQVNDKLTLNYQELDEKYRTLQLKQSDKTEELRSFWKDHFQKLQESMQSRFVQEKKELQQQIDRKNEQYNSVQAQLILNAGLFKEKTQLQNQIQAQILFSKNMDIQIKEYQSTIESTRNEVFEKQKRVLEVENVNSQLYRRISELEKQNSIQAEQLQGMSKIEGNAHSVVNENIRLQEIAEKKSEENLVKNKLLESERIQYEASVTELKKAFENRIGVLKDNHENQIQSWSSKEKNIFNELQKKNLQIQKLNQQLEQIEDEKVKLLEKAEQLKIVSCQKRDLETNLSALTTRKNDLEAKLSQLVEQNKTLNSSLEDRLNEIEIWKETNQLSAEEIQLLNSQYQHQLLELHSQFQEDISKQKAQFDKNVTEFQNQMSELAGQFNLIELKKTEDQRVLYADFKKKLEIERERFQIATEQTNLLKSAITETELKHSQLLGLYQHLERTHERKINIINNLEDELTKSRLETAGGLQQIDAQNCQINTIRKDYEDLKHAHLMLLQQYQYDRQQQINKNTMQTERQEYQGHESQHNRLIPQKRKEGKDSASSQQSEPKDKENDIRTQQAGHPSRNQRTAESNKRVPNSNKGQQLFEENGGRDIDRGAEIRAAVESLRVENKSQLLAKMNNYTYYRDPSQSFIQQMPIQTSHVQDLYTQQNGPIRNPFNDSIEGSSQVLFPPRQIFTQSGKAEDRQPQNSAQKDQNYSNQDRAQYHALLRDLDYFKSKEQSQSMLLEVLKKENEKLSSQFKDLEKKYYSQNDWIVDQYENINGNNSAAETKKSSPDENVHDVQNEENSHDSSLKQNNTEPEGEDAESLIQESHVHQRQNQREDNQDDDQFEQGDEYDYDLNQGEEQVEDEGQDNQEQYEVDDNKGEEEDF